MGGPSGSRVFVSGEHRDAWLRQQRLGKWVGTGKAADNRAVEGVILARGWAIARAYDGRVREALATGHEGVAFTLRLPWALAEDSSTPGWVLGGQIGLVKDDLRRTLRRRGLTVAFAMYATQPHQDGRPHWHGVLMVRPGEVERARALVREIVRDRVDAQLGAGAAARHRVLRFSETVEDPVEIWTGTSRFSHREPLTGWVWYVLRPYLTSRDQALSHGRRSDAEGRVFPSRQADAVTTRAWLWASAIGDGYSRSIAKSK